MRGKSRASPGKARGIRVCKGVDARKEAIHENLTLCVLHFYKPYSLHFIITVYVLCAYACVYMCVGIWVLIYVYCVRCACAHVCMGMQMLCVGLCA